MLSPRRSTLFLLMAVWVGCHVVSGLDELTVGDEGGGLSGPSASGSPMGAGGMSTSTGVGATGGVCENDCCCPHSTPSCTGAQAQAQRPEDVAIGGGGGGPVPAVGGSGGAPTSGVTSVGQGGAMTSGSAPPVLCTECVCGIELSCCDSMWSAACAMIANDTCRAECGCPGL